MKSSKDIEPRVGMQLYAAEYQTKRHRIVQVRNMPLGVSTDTQHKFHDNKWGHDSSQWNCGDFEIEWIPPTDEERKMFVAAADRQISYIMHGCDCDDTENNDCRLYDALGGAFRYDKRASIALSLALDGADYDNMPEGFE